MENPLTLKILKLAAGIFACLSFAIADSFIGSPLLGASPLPLVHTLAVSIFSATVGGMIYRAVKEDTEIPEVRGNQVNPRPDPVTCRFKTFSELTYGHSWEELSKLIEPALLREKCLRHLCDQVVFNEINNGWKATDYFNRGLLNAAEYELIKAGHFGNFRQQPNQALAAQ